MSESFQYNSNGIYGSPTPFDDAVNEAQRRQTANLVSNTLARATSLALPDPTSTDPVVSRTPGQGAIASSLKFAEEVQPYVNKADTIASYMNPTGALINAGRLVGVLPPAEPSTPLRTALPDVMDWADKTEAATGARAKEIIPVPTPTDDLDKKAADLGWSIGAMGIPIPYAKAGMTALKTATEAAGPVARFGAGALNAMTHVLAPSVVSGTTFGIGTGLGTAVSIATPTASPDAPAPTDTLPATTATASTPPSGASIIAPANAAGNEPPTQPPNATVAKPPPTPPAVQAAQGDTPVPYMPPVVKQDSMFYPLLQNTMLDVAGGIAITAALLKGGPRAMKFVEELVEGTRASQFHAASTAFNAERDVIATGAPVVAKETAPLPGQQGLFGNIRKGVANTMDYVFGDNYHLNSYSDASSASKTEAELMRTETGSLNNNQIFQGRLKVALQTGEDQQTGVRWTPHETSWKKVAAFTKDEADAYNAARYAGDEMDNRLRIGKTQPTAAPAASHVGLATRDDVSLTGDIAYARTNFPRVAEVLDEDAIRAQRIPEMLMWSGMLDQQTMRQLQALHPHYLPTGTFEGLIKNPLAARDLTPWSGDLTARIPAVELDKQHIDRLLAARDQNQLRANFIQQGYDFQQRDPQGARIFEPSKNKVTGAWVEAPGTLPVRIKGELQYHYVHNPVLRNALDQSPSQTGTLINGLNHIRQGVQSTITGPIAMALGHVFPLIGPMRYSAQMAITRNSGEFGGYLEKGVRSVLGDRVRFGDPTAMVTWPREIVAATGAKGAQSLAALLHPESTSWANVKLRAMRGDNYVNALHNTLQRTWERSIWAEMERLGARNAAGMSYTQTPVRGVGAGTQAAGVTSVANNLVPELFRTNGMIPGVAPTLVRMKNFVNEAMSIIGESAHAQFFRLNNQLGDEARVLATRGIVGDPGVHGSGSVMRGLSHVTEYQNIALQEAKAVAGRIAKSPLETVWNATTVFGLAALYEAYSAMMAGPDHVAHYENETAAGAPARYASIYIPGQPPEAALKIPLGINVSWMYPMIRQVMAEALSLKSHPTDTTTAQWAWHGLTDFFGKHVTQDTLDSTVAAASRGIPPVVPHAAGVAGNLLYGKQMDVTLQSAYDRGAGNAPIANMFTHGMPGGDPRAPGRVQGADTLTDSVNGNVFKQTLASAFGIAGTAIKDAVETYHNVTVNGGDKWGAIGNMLESYKGRLQDSAPYLNGILWNKSDNLSAKTPLVQRVDEARNTMRQFAGFMTDEAWAGYTRRGGTLLPMAPGQQNKVPSDPLLKNLYTTAAIKSAEIERVYMPAITDLEKERSLLRNSPLSPELVTQKRNEYTRNIQAKYERVAGVINELNDELSRKAGKRVTINTIDFGPGATAAQFQH